MVRITSSADTLPIEARRPVLLDPSLLEKRRDEPVCPALGKVEALSDLA
jgi:hypothetical protein